MSPEIEQKIKELEMRLSVLERERQDISDKQYFYGDLVISRQIQLGGPNGPKILYGEGNPASRGLTAPQGSIYTRTDGAANNTLFANYGGGALWEALS